MRVSILLVCMTTLMGCTRTVDTAGPAISASDLADLKSHVDAIERRDHHRLRATFSTITLPGEPRTLAVMRRLGYVSGSTRHLALSPTTSALGSRCGPGCLSVDLLDEHLTRVVSMTETKTAFARTGVRKFIIELAVRPLVTPLADGLIRASAIECAKDLGTPVTLSATGATARVPFFLGQRDSRSDPNSNLVPSRSFDLACPELG